VVNKERWIVWMDAVVVSVQPGSPASGTIIKPGDTLRKINGSRVVDVLDYMYLSYDRRLILELSGTDGKMKLVRINKPEGTDVGLEFDTYLMDNERSCANKCIFCFIDQLPGGMRKTLYYKDDDVRLSFLQGNYVTLTNLSQSDINRIIERRISPINVSVHTLDPELRAFMLGTKDGAAGIGALHAFAGAGITLNCQIVCCPGINDETELLRTMEELYALGPCVNSVSVVPVGLTKHRQGLPQLRPFDLEHAFRTIRKVEDFSVGCLRERGMIMFFCADELYIRAGIALPPDEFYEEYPQLENGVGMMRLFITEFEEALCKFEIRNPEFGVGGGTDTFGNRNPEFGACGDRDDFTIVTGVAAGEYLTNLLKTASEKCGKIPGKVISVRNDFFGDSVTVSGLVTGGDIIAQLRGRDLGSRILIPQNMLRRGQDVFLDDITVPELSERLGVDVRIVKQHGADFLSALMGG